MLSAIVCRIFADGGLSPVLAADRLFRYLEVARAMQRTGISLKEGSAQLELDFAHG